MKVERVFNNNVVLASTPDSRQVVLTGRGVGFGVHPGAPVDEQRVAQRFVPDATHSQEQLAAFLTDIPPEHLLIATEILELARVELGLNFAQSMVIPLADHLSFAVKRVRSGISLDFPLRAEVAHLYPQELAAASLAVTHLRERTGLPIPADEAVPIALHLVNAQFATDDLSRTFQMTEVFHQIFSVLESAYQRRFEASSMNAARFVTHLRYFFVRVEGAKQLDDKQTGFGNAIRTSFPEAYACALKVRALLELRLGKPITDDEVTYLTLHVARLAADG